MKNLLSKPLFRILIIIILLLLIRTISREIADLLDKFIKQNIFADFSYKTSIYKIFMVGFSLMVMLILPDYTLKDFGFRMPDKFNWFKLFWLTFVIVIGSTIIFSIIYMGILNNILAGGEQQSIDIAGGRSFLAIFLTIWIWSSFSEEVYTRGLLQSLLQNLKKYRFLKLSLPVWISGLFFGALHLSIYESGKLLFTLFIVTNTTILGLLAANYREKTNSIYPAIVVHFLANAYNSIFMLL